MTLNGSRAGWIAWKMEKGDCGEGMLIKNSSKNNIPRKAEVRRLEGGGGRNRLFLFLFVIYQTRYIITQREARWKIKSKLATFARIHTQRTETSVGRMWFSVGRKVGRSKDEREIKENEEGRCIRAMRRCEVDKR